jgi:histidyl-tRNA synthetase
MWGTGFFQCVMCDTALTLSLPLPLRVCVCGPLQVRRQLRAAKLHVDVDLSDRTMQKKVREAQLAQYNYILVVGEQEKVRQGSGAGALM